MTEDSIQQLYTELTDKIYGYQMRYGDFPINIILGPTAWQEFISYLYCLHSIWKDKYIGGSNHYFFNIPVIPCLTEGISLQPSKEVMDFILMKRLSNEHRNNSEGLEAGTPPNPGLEGGPEIREGDSEVSREENQSLGEDPILPEG